MPRSEKLTITLPREVLGRIRDAVRRRGGTVSGYVANAVMKYQRRERLGALLEELDAELGRPSEEDRRWAENVMSGDPSVRYRPTESGTRPGRRKDRRQR